MAVDIIQEKCTGCSACQNACPTDAILMIPDEKGFLYPTINEEMCIDCHVCESVCPVKSFPSIFLNSIYGVFAAWSLHYETRYQSTSGGIFTEIAQSIFSKGGCVFGAGYRDNFLVEHRLAETSEELMPLQQSKYIQSEIGLIFREVRKQLDIGREVLFCGTPCQCIGLQQYLQKAYKNLLLCDFICRGVNAPNAFLAYLKELENRYQSKATRVWFKNKQYSWNQFGTKIIFENGQEYFGSRDEDNFMYGFIRKGLNLYMRPSCYECKLKENQTVADITLGDFWGVGLGDEKERNGVSAVILRTEKGKQAFDELKNIYRCEKSMEDVEKGNACLKKPPTKSRYSNFFWEGIAKGMKFSQIISEIKVKNEGEKDGSM